MHRSINRFGRITKTDSSVFRIIPDAGEFYRAGVQHFQLIWNVPAEAALATAGFPLSRE